MSALTEALDLVIDLHVQLHPNFASASLLFEEGLYYYHCDDRSRCNCN
jgi:hypothetical protein